MVTNVLPKAEVKTDLLTEYDEEACIRGWRRDGILIGRQEKAIETAKNMLKKKYPESDISEITGLPLNQINELKKQLPARV